MNFPNNDSIGSNSNANVWFRGFLFSVQLFNLQLFSDCLLLSGIMNVAVEKNYFFGLPTGDKLIINKYINDTPYATRGCE